MGRTRDATKEGQPADDKGPQNDAQGFVAFLSRAAEILLRSGHYRQSLIFTWLKKRGEPAE